MSSQGSILQLPNGAAIPYAELRFEFSRSGGPGGQNVNKVNTRVTLLFDLAGSPSLRPDHKSAIRSTMSSRINKEGVLRVSSSKHRTQAANREATVERFTQLFAAALTPGKNRYKTRIPARAHASRLEGKARLAQKKRLRQHSAREE